MMKLLIALATTVALAGPAPAHARGPETAAVSDYCYEQHGGFGRMPNPEAMDCIDSYWKKTDPALVERVHGLACERGGQGEKAEADWI